MREIGRVLRRDMGNALLDVLWPQACVFCSSDDVEQDEVLCLSCRRAISVQTELAYCPRCGFTAPPFGLTERGCSHCPPGALPYERVIRVGAYSGTWAALIRAYKFGRREELTSFLAGELARRIARSEVFESIDAVVAVPTCWQHSLRRRFYAAGAVARAAAAVCGLPLANVLQRRSGGPHQVGLTLAVRRDNVRGRFRLARGCQVGGARVCVVDDVITSGATVAECARVLKRAGAAAIYVAVLARARDDAGPDDGYREGAGGS